MASHRGELQSKLEEILGSSNVYYNPPESIKMSYPAIRFTRDILNGTYADDSIYQLHEVYQIIAIYSDPDSQIPYQIMELPMCNNTGHYVSENLYHDVFTINY